MSLLIKNGTLVTHSWRAKANILLQEGKVESITVTEPSAEEVIDAEGLLVMPGVIDPHVHFRQPGMDSEDWKSGSRSALAGGVTTVLDMPNTKPPTTDAERLEEKRRLVLESVGSGPCVNYGFHFGATSGNMEEIWKVMDLGSIPELPMAASVKVFMGSSTGDLLLTDLKVLERIIHTSRLVTVHAEDEAVIKEHTGEPDHSSRRPKSAALSAIRKLLAVGVPGRVYVLHVTSWEEAALASPFHREATPHHLFLSTSSTSRLGSYAKVNPPIRDEADRASLWRALDSGMIDTIGSDHAPHLREAKEREVAPSGVPGVETSLPLMINASLEGLITLEKVVELMCYNPSRIFRIARKGALESGMDGDVTIVDPKKDHRVRGDELHYKCGWTPYEGMLLKGWPVATILGGRVAYRDGDFYPVRGEEVSYAP
ncbi:MAG: dihydroorotase [Candidatus Methanomethylicaceae archaeon]|jgi:dihydroorotase